MIRLKAVLFVFLISLAVVLSGCGGSGGSGPTLSGTWGIAKSHVCNFSPGSVGQYKIVITNPGTGSSSGTVTVTDTLPAGLTATNIGGTGGSHRHRQRRAECARDFDQHGKCFRRWIDQRYRE